MKPINIINKLCESEEVDYKQEFIDYCKGKVQKLGKKIKYPIFDDDEDYKETFRVVMLGPDGTEWVTNESDEDAIVQYWDGEALNLVLPPYGSLGEVIANLKFSAIDKKTYEETLEYWDDIDMNYIMSEVNK